MTGTQIGTQNVTEYRVTEIEKASDTNPGMAGTLQVEIHSDVGNGGPGMNLFETMEIDLTGTDIATVRPTGAITLQPSTTYYVVMTSVNSRVYISGTIKDEEDAGGIGGWSIANNAVSEGSPGVWHANSGQPMRLKLTGYAVLNVKPTSENTSIDVRQAGHARAFSVDEFKFTDTNDGQTLENVRFTSVPSRGTLALDGQAVTANQVVATADIEAGKLTYTPPTEESGNALETFSFKVNDGIEDSASAYTVTVNVEANNPATGAPRINPPLE